MADGVARNVQGSLILEKLLEEESDAGILKLTKTAIEEADLPAMCYALGLMHNVGIPLWRKIESELEAGVRARIPS